MKGLIVKTLVVALGLGLTGLTGCVGVYRNLVDPCWPERYNFQSRTTVREAFVAQVENGHKLDQTVWAHHFEIDPKTNQEKLTVGGQEHLKYLARRRPVADTQLFVQTSGDDRIDSQRVVAIKNYLSKQLVAQGNTFEVAVVDPAEVGIHAVPIAGRNMQSPQVQGALPRLQQNFQGMNPMTTGGTGGAGAGASGSSGSTGSTGR